MAVSNPATHRRGRRPIHSCACSSQAHWPPPVRRSFEFGIAVRFRGLSLYNAGADFLRKPVVPRNRRRLLLRQSVVAVELLEIRQLLSSLPSGWTDSDIGSPTVSGSASYTSSSNTFSVSGS